MDQATLAVVAIVTFGWAIVSERLARHNLTGPSVFVVAGFLLANPNWGVVSVDVESATVHHLAEITLGLLLFVDASSIPVAGARRDLPLTSRLLGIGLPLAILFGTGVAVVVFPDLPVALAGLLGASLAPTDAALSASVIADERLPSRLRRVLIVESGLNDGVATPIVTLCIAGSATVLGVVGESYESGFGAVGELLVGVVTGGGVALVGGRLVDMAGRRGWAQHGSRRLATVSLALLAFLLASEAGGNPFVAAFVGGLVFGAWGGTSAETSTELAELLGDLLSLVIWFVFGAAFVLPALEHLDARTAVYAVLSLTVVRMVPVVISLVGAGQDRGTTAFVGWFGPRGLASIVFALLALEELGADPRVATVLDAIAVTVLLSVIAHGITARPLATRYVSAVSRMGRGADQVTRRG